MATLLQKTLALVTGAPAKATRPLKQTSERDLIRLESEIGREIFGPIPAGHRREFFCLDEHTWVWHEEWIDAVTGKLKVSTTRYEIHPNGILKVQQNQPYKFIEGQELQHFHLAIKMYYERVMRDIYKRDPTTGHHLVPPAVN